MNGIGPDHGDALERIENLRDALSMSLDSARRIIDTTRRLQASETARHLAALHRLDRANAALSASAGLID